MPNEAYGDPAEEAFGQLRTEVALLRRAVEGLAAAEERHEPVDYGPTLGKMAVQLAAVDKRMEALAQSPLLSMTPARVAGEVQAVTARARQEAQGDWSRAQRALDDAVRSLGEIIPRPRAAHDQRRWVIAASAGGVMAGIVLWIGLSGPIARALPDRWQVAERMAAATLKQDRWSAGQRLVAKAKPESWRAMVDDLRLVDDNRSALEACRAKGSATCKISTRPVGASR
ncbi:DUF6118 family protein [Caulobacter sp.]|uniref:DUF6118 family protein n=1 Tax=Caulobacter sp. TaxID=78 RepID=UPI001B15A2EC|nr:DUF6118 family protein [Caulobacter sp.]MBO9545643.1 hypothetical protein [Caulobacter sp.]